MTLDKARELLGTQISFGGGYDGNAGRLIIGEVAREGGEGGADGLIRELRLGEIFGFGAGQPK